MNWANVRLILARELRDQLRDRRTLFVIAVLPLLLYPMLGMAFFQVAQFMRQHPSKVLVLGAAQVDQLTDLPPLFQNTQFDPQLFDDPQQAKLLEVSFGRAEAAPAAGGWDPAVARHWLQKGAYHAVIYFPPGFGDRLERFQASLAAPAAGGAAAGQSSDDLAKLLRPQIYHNSADEKSQIAYHRLSRLLAQWRGAIVGQYFKELQIPAQASQPFEIQPMDLAARGRHTAAVWSKVLPFVLLIWALTGAFYPAIDVCAGEKERGTLETLLSSPAGRSEIVWGKLLTIMIFSVITSTLNLVSMALTGIFIIEQLNHLPGVAGTGLLAAPAPDAALWLLLALLPVAAMFSALCLALAAFARSTKEGQYYLMPMLLVTMPLMILPMAPGVELTLGNSLIPVTGIVLLLRTLLEGNTMEAVVYAPSVIIVTAICCLLAVRWAVDQFNKETILFQESERFDLGLWMKQLVRDRRATPTVSEALACFVLILLIQFFMNLALPPPRLDMFGDVAQRVFVSLAVMIALPALLMTVLLTRRPLQTLLLEKKPPLYSIPLAVVLAVALHPVMLALQVVVERLYPISDAVRAQAKFLGALFDRAPNVWLPLLLIAVLPAVCEEVAFRGFILSGLRHLGRKWWAIVLSAAFFGLAHGVLQQSIMAALLGVVLGLLAVQTGSLVPCILFHMTHNGLLLLASQVVLGSATFARHPVLELFLQPTADGGPGLVFRWPGILAGAVVAGYALHRLCRRRYQPTEEEQLQDALIRQSLIADR